MNITAQQHLKQVLLVGVISIGAIVWISYRQWNRVINTMKQLEAQKIWWQENYEMLQKVYSSDWFKQQQKASLEQAISQMDSKNPTANTNNPTAENTAPTNQEAPKNTIKKVSLEVLQKIKDDAYIVWNKDAKVMIIEYSDLQCPYCKRHFESKTLETLVTKYNGKVSKTMRSFPLGFHQYAQKAWEWAECYANGSVEKYFTFVWAVFAKDINTNWSNQAIFDINKALWWDEAWFKSCVDSNKYAQKIKDQQAEWSSFGVTGTPWNVIVNMETGEYVLLAWAYPIGDFEKVIDTFIK